MLPAWDGTPRRFVFETVTEATPLIEDAEVIERPGAGNRLVIPAIKLDSDVARQGSSRWTASSAIERQPG